MCWRRFSVFKYLGSLAMAVGGVEADVQQRVLEGSKVHGAVIRVLKGRAISCGEKKTFYRQVLVPMVTHSSETWGLRRAERRRLNVFEMKYLRPMVGFTIGDGIRNEDI